MSDHTAERHILLGAISWLHATTTRKSKPKTISLCMADLLPSWNNKYYPNLLRPLLSKPSFLSTLSTLSMWVRNASAEVDQHSKYAGFVCTCAITTSIMIGAVSLRAYDRGKSSRISVDDWVTFVSAVCLTILNALYCGLTLLGFCCDLRSTCCGTDTSWARITTRAASARESS
jgi:hypothetical protein